MKITVLGCGALGKIWLDGLFHYGHDIQGWLKVQQPFFTVHIIDFNGVEKKFNLTANNIIHLANSELLLVTLKAWQISNALRILLPKLNAECIVLLIHNGLGVYEELSFITNPLLLGNTTHAAYRSKDKIYHIYPGVTYIGPGNFLGGQKIILAGVLNKSLPKVKWDQNIKTSNWIKFAASCVINPLTVLYRCRNGGLKNYPKHIKSMCSEVVMVMNYEGYNVSYKSFLSYVEQLIISTANNFSSMLQDITYHRRTEIDYINGYLLRCAKIHGISVPKNQLLFNIIKKKEAMYINYLLN